MAKKKVKFIKPGSMAQQVPECEKLRRAKIEWNNIRLAERGFERLANSLVGLEQKGKTKNTKEAKNMRAMDDDDDEYQPLEDENNFSSDDHMSFYSDDEEAIDAIMNERKKKKAEAQHTSTPHTEMPPVESTQGSMSGPTIESTVAPTPTPTQELPVEHHTLSTTPSSLPQHMARASTSMRVRGATRGINTERLIAASCGTKLVVEVPQEDKFDILEYDEKEHVRRGIDRKCKKLYRTWRHNIKQHYEALVEDGKDPFIKPYRGVSGEVWAWMIGNIWTNKDKEELVKKGKKARVDVPFNHTMGSQSFAAVMSAKAKENDGQRPNIADFYELTHYSKKEWVAPICQQVHVQLKARHQEDESRRKEDEALGLPVTMPQEEMPTEVLGKKFYVKECSVALKRPSSKRSSAKSHDEVQVLKNQVE
ncbi:hypothetical protein Vadar_032980 [Vaccinium darrowii]|uniref:Uncharacterized protein n=1 Tax=Vaccinium darrowii TaxID=229202 RepID=A0ACB7YTD8_9ERIC|nr:hypothetical protein Vadar_032980 [Vaccinium darrowii]